MVELCEPAALIFNKITRSPEWCEDWKIEYGTPLEKVPNPANEEQLWIIFITHQPEFLKAATMRPCGRAKISGIAQDLGF